MPIPNKKTTVLRYNSNTKGKDYVVGDIHGCLEALLDALSKLNFDEKVDRLFSVGDLIDRGPDSFECGELIYKPWFYAVRGNHEQMCIDSMLKKSPGDQYDWFHNGGRWMEDHDRNEIMQLATAFDMLPTIIVVGSGKARFNIVHGELVHFAPAIGGVKLVPVTNKMIDRFEFTDQDQVDMLWGRRIISTKSDQPQLNKHWHSNKLSQTFVGHTPVTETIRVQQHIYLDNGAVYHTMPSVEKRDTHRLVIACPTTQMLHTYGMTWRSLTEKPINSIPHLY